MSSMPMIRPLPFSSSLRVFNHTRIRQHLLQHRVPLRNYANKPADTSELRPLVLEKPDKFRPPSHPARKPGPRRSFGPQLTQEELDRQNVKQYPSMMPPEDSFQYKLLTSRGFHAWFAMSILITLAVATFYMDFHSKNKFIDLIPPASLFWSHPFQYLSQYGEVYKMHKQAETAENMLKKQRKQDEVRKRREYMRAHGVEHEGPYGLGTVEGDEYRKKAQEEREHWSMQEQASLQRADELRAQRAQEQGLLGADEVRGFGGETRKVKKWFGIW